MYGMSELSAPTMNLLEATPKQDREFGRIHDFTERPEWAETVQRERKAQPAMTSESG